jgi:hypothetical protein
MRRTPRVGLVCLIVAVVLVQPSVLAQKIAEPDPRLPEVSLEVAVRVKVNGTMLDGFRLFRLRCRDGYCHLLNVNLRCQNESGQSSLRLFPRPLTGILFPEFFSTLYRDMTVTPRFAARLLIVQLPTSEPDGRSYATTLEFGYAKRVEVEATASRVTRFSGHGIQEFVSGKPAEVEYVPLVADGPGPFKRATRPLSCPSVDLPGVEPETATSDR